MPYDIFAIVLPVFILIGIGYATARSKLLSESAGDALGQYVYHIAIPVLVFKTMATAQIGDENPWGLWGAYFSGVAIAWGLASVIVRKGFAREARAGVVAGISASFANTVMVGIPLISSAYGDAGLIPFLLILSVHLPVMTITISILMERAAVIDGYGERLPPKDLFRRIVLNLATNPIVIAIMLGLVWRLAAFPLSGLFEDVLSRIESTALPVALLSLGMSMVQYGIRGNMLPGIVLSVLKLVLMPAVVFFSAIYIFHIPPLWAAVATATAACPTGVNAYIFANRYGTGHAMSANSIALTTFSAVVSTSMWIAFIAYWQS